MSKPRSLVAISAPRSSLGFWSEPGRARRVSNNSSQPERTVMVPAVTV